MGREGLAENAVLDAGPLIGLDRGDERTRAVIARITKGGGGFIIPAPVLAQVWRDGSRQARLATLIRSRDTHVEPFDGLRAKAAGALLGRSGTSDVVDASVVISARRHQALVLTTDPEDIRRIDPNLEVETI